MQFGVFECSIYHKHEKMNHQLLPAGSLWRLLRIPREFSNLRIRLIEFPLEGFIPSSTLINSVAQLLFSMVALALLLGCYPDPPKERESLTSFASSTTIP